MESHSKWKLASFIFVLTLLGVAAFLESATTVSAQEEGEEGYVPPTPPPGKPPTWLVVFPSLAVAILIITLILLALGMRWG